MAKIVELLKPILFAFINSPEVKNLVVTLLEKYAARTDNKIDDTVVQIVREKLLK